MMKKRLAPTRNRTRRWRLIVAACAVAAGLGAVQLAYAADGTDVARKLGNVPALIGEVTGSIGPGGEYGQQDNAAAVPFLGGSPATVLPELLDVFKHLADFKDFNPPGDRPVQEVADLVTQVDGKLGGGKISPTYTCGAAACNLGTNEVSELTSIRLDFSIGGSTKRLIDFSGVGLPSLGFTPKAAKLDVDLSWSLNVGLVADLTSVRLVPVAGPELDLGIAISVPTTNYDVNLGALVVQATTLQKPTLGGHLLVNVTDDGTPSFALSPGAGFAAKWGLETKAGSPLEGIKGQLSIIWPLSIGADGVNPTGLQISVDNVSINTKKFVGDSMQEAAETLREIIHPIRTATAPMLEPIPGLSDLSSVVGGGDVTMLKLMGQAKGADPLNPKPFPTTDFEVALDRIQKLDDVVSDLAGEDGELLLGSFMITGDEALKPKDEILDPTKIVGDLKNIYEECTPCQETVDTLLTAVNGGPTPGEGGFEFDLPVLREPESLAGLLLGRDVDLITFDTGPLGYDDKLNIPIARFLIFSVKIEGQVVAKIHLKGGVDTRGISDALLKPGGEPADVLNGVYLQNSGTDPLVRLFSGAGLDFAAGIEVIEVSLRGGPSPDIELRVPASTPQGKLRPATVENGIGCALLEGEGKANFSVFIKAIFDYWIDDYEETLAEHTFLTDQDLCEPAANEVEPAHPEGRTLVINTAGQRGIPSDKPDSVKVFMRHDPVTLAPTWIVVTVNDNRHKDYPAADFDQIRYVSSDERDVDLKIIRNDDIPFEKDVEITTAGGDDDVLVDSKTFSKIAVNGGDDKVTKLATGTTLVSGGPGDDNLTGGENLDVLGGDAGMDVLDGGAGFDILSGGADDDVVYDSSPDRNCLSGGPGNDLIVDGPGADYLSGDEPHCGESAVQALDPEDPGDSGDGNDDIVTGGGADFVVGGGGDDDIRLHSSGAFPKEEDRADPIDAIWSEGVVVYGNGGNDIIKTPNGPDRIHGGPGNDDIDADAGPIDTSRVVNGDDDTIHGGTGEDLIKAREGIDLVFGDNGIDKCLPPFPGQPAEQDDAGGADTVHGGPDADRIALEAGDDKAFGEGSSDTICGHAGVDTILGGFGSDLVFGGSDDDKIDGEDGEDELYGNVGSDTIKGGNAADRIVGGSYAPAIADAGDTIDGGDEPDVIIGDNGLITAGPPMAPSVFDLFSNDPSRGGSDTINGGAGEDRIFGGRNGDTIHGDAEDDHLEGNSGDDAIYGDAGEDDIIGGTSPEALPGAAAGQTAADAADVGETILSGGAGRDVIIGDNGIITRPGGTDPILGGVARAVTLLDRERTGAALAAVSGGDYVEGNLDSDRIYGQGGADYVKGNEADDFVEGNQDGDRLEGNDGEDDLIGGSSLSSAPGVGDPDGADQIAGGAGADVLLGDNAAITRATTGAGSGFDWDSVANNWLGQTARRSITLLDKATLRTDNFGADVLSGGADVDVLFGQDGNDQLFGGSHDDAMEGNGGSDVLYGDQVAPPTGDVHESGQPQLDGTPGPDGQDDQIGGSSWIKASAGGAITGQRDGSDELHGDGNADVQLGDNGRILRVIVNGQYQTYQPTTGKATIVRQAAGGTSPRTELPARFDVGAASSAGVWGNDVLLGNDGDDLQLGQDGDDTLYGGAADDDMYGELGNDRMFGEAGQDAMVGDRGVITNRLVSTPGATISVTAPPAVQFTPYAAHPLDRRVNLNADGDGSPLQAPGMTTGGNDFMRGGPDHDAMHGAAGNDLMNGDAGGDYLFGDDGADVMWGGKGRECANPADLACLNDRGVNDAYVDYLFGGRGLKTDPVTGGADILDFRPRPGLDPMAWFEITSTRSTDPVADHQHHQGIDWIYGGWDRDVMQANVADNGPNAGDRLIDWTGAYNLYTHCPAAYGGYNDIRQLSPSMQSFLEQLAFALGAGQSLADLRTKGTSGYNELALVYNADVKANSGSAYPTTPGHFEQFSCEP